MQVTQQHRFQGKPPQIPLYPHVNVEAQQADTSPFYVSLKLDCSPELAGLVATHLPNLGTPWVGHAEDEENGLWVKAYIPPGWLRECLRRLKRRRGVIESLLTVDGDWLELKLIPGVDQWN